MHRLMIYFKCLKNNNRRITHTSLLDLEEFKETNQENSSS